MKKLDPHTIPLESINLIEASAGTGKSWTVTLLYLRLILEKGLTVDQILVVTFTDAATKELRDDIRKRLIDALLAFEMPTYSKTDEYSKLIQSNDDKAEAIRRLNRAKLSLDEAAIFTIHSFCQRALNENAFESSLPFESELIDDDKGLMQGLTDDYWRRNFAQAPAPLLFKLQQKSITPDSLLKDIRSATGKPYLTVCGPRIDSVSPEKWKELDNLFQKAINTWREQGDEITCLLTQPELDEDGYLANFKKSREQFLKEIRLIAVSGVTPNIIDSKLYWLGTKEKTKAKFKTIEHSFFQKWQDFLDCRSELDSIAEDYISRIKIDLLQYLQEELPKEKQRLGVLSFDDLLLNLQAALQKNTTLASALRKKYQAALIDEFQDTDPIQYDIFSRIYQDTDDCVVFLVGDPKQAIYSFRGGDIHTYLKAKSMTSSNNHYTLETNWRSHPDLINAFNNVYMSCDNPFQDRLINYVEINAGNKITDELTIPKKRDALCFWRVKQLEEKLTGEKLRENIAQSVAGDISELLNASSLGKAKIGGKPITGGDIAILVRSHSQGDLINSALGSRGIASVQSSKDSIFETHEAVEMISLLTAIVDPQKEDNVRRALVTDLIGISAKDLLAFESDTEAWEKLLLNMQNWHYQWKNQGFLPMMRDVMRSEKIRQHLMSYENGERRLTNVLHLSEIIHHQSRKQSLGRGGVLRWLRQQQQSAGLKEAELRLESDEKLVKIVTIYKSKGLEYPIVYCPFVGVGAKAKIDKVYTFHKDNNSCLEIGSPEADVHKSIKEEEQRAEDARLLYVALTRAKYQCIVSCVPEAISGTPDRTALGWLLTDGKSIQSGSSKAVKENNAEYYLAYNERLKTLSENQNISVLDLPDFDANLRYQTIQTDQLLSAKTFTAEIKSQAKITSFSGLTAGAHAEVPDHDNQSEYTSPPVFTLFEAFPRGATAGSALHEIYENIDFIQPLSDQEDVILNALNKWGFTEEHQAAATQLIENSLQAELFENFSLKNLSKENRLNEMEFYLPLERLQIEDLQQILFKHLPQEWQVIRDAINMLDFDQVEGYLKGFIDLIFEYQGQYYVADYKSNSLNDYQPDALLAVMADSHYYLQYLLYSVALHRYLKKRLPNYHWEMHFGGVYYLFIRGMKNGIEEQQFRSGIFFDKPSSDLIEALDSLFLESKL